jgi:hypothetical protein
MMTIVKLLLNKFARAASSTGVAQFQFFHNCFPRAKLIFQNFGVGVRALALGIVCLWIGFSGNIPELLV